MNTATKIGVAAFAAALIAGGVWFVTKPRTARVDSAARPVMEAPAQPAPEPSSGGALESSRQGPRPAHPGVWKRIADAAPAALSAEVVARAPTQLVKGADGGAGARFDQDADRCFSAYFDPTGKAVIEYFQEYGIVPPYAQDVGKPAGQIGRFHVENLDGAEIDPATATLVVRRLNGEEQPRGVQSFSTKAQRDQGRPTLAGKVSRHVVEMLVDVRRADSKGALLHVQLGVEFSWDETQHKWMITATNYYGRPNGSDMMPPYP